MNKILITGSSGLIGSAIAEKFAEENWEIIGVDNYLRSYFLQSKEAETKGQIQQLQNQYSNISQYNFDINDIKNMKPLLKDVDAVVHCAAQVSHPRSLEIPLEDAQTNIMGTLKILEILRNENANAPFAFISSNKVYGDYPNYFNYKIIENQKYRRFENLIYDSFNEELPIDRCGHTPFGVSKAAADLYTQEYAHNYGLTTTCFRGGCLIGKNQKAVETHGFLGFFTKQVLLKKKIHIFGEGYRVRDNIHSSDVAEVVYHWVNHPKPNAFGLYGKPYNLGGMRENSVSIFETLNAIQEKTGLRAIFEESAPRESDHIWWITDMSKFKNDYPEWKGVSKDLDYIFNELIQNWIDVFNLDIELIEKDYFKKLRSS